MTALQLKEICAVLGINCAEDKTITGISTDSRKITEGCLFIALKGERFDGHDFVRAAFEHGAAAALCSSPVDDCGGEVLLTEDTGEALLRIAAYYRSLFSIPVVGVTGSVGKTSTKEMIYSVLSEKYLTLKNEGNLNNEIGLPTTVFRLDSTHEAAILEMGMSAFGEISRLSQTAQPSVGVITNIGVSHIEFLGSREGILKAKLEILDGLRKNGPLIVNGDDDLLCKVSSDEHPVITFGINDPDCDFRAVDIGTVGSGTEFTVVYGGKSRKVKLPCVGTHNVYNALAAFAVGIQLGVGGKKAAEGLSKYVTSGMRQRFTEFNGITLIEDCYNAGPDSVKAAIDVLKSLTARSKVLVFGDMLELGKISEEAHREVGEQVSLAGISTLLTYGEMAAYAAEEALKRGVKAESFTDKAELTKALKSRLVPGDAVLFKASRGMKLEEVIEAYKEQ